MAQLDTGGGEVKKGGKPRAKKLSSSVDLTAMVDLAFLLITFFMLTTTLNKPQSMDLSLPDKSDTKEKPVDQKVDENRTITILMGKDNTLKYYKGLLESPIVPPTDVAYGKNGIRQVLVEEKQKAIQYTGDPEKNLIVIIKPNKESTYRNLVDILDEMAIVKVPTYAISEIYEVEENILNGLEITQ